MKCYFCLQFSRLMFCMTCTVSDISENALRPLSVMHVLDGSTFKLYYVK